VFRGAAASRLNESAAGGFTTEGGGLKAEGQPAVAIRAPHKASAVA